MNTLFYDPRPQFCDENGNPYSGGFLSFYEAGTSTLKEIYSDRDGNTPLPNPITLDAGGYLPQTGVWLGTGYYKVRLETSESAEVWTVDNVSGSASSSGAFITSATIDTVTALPSLPAGAFGVVRCLGYYETFDIGGGLFRWEPLATAADDGGTYIAPSTAPAQGRWVRQYSESVIHGAQYGVLSNAQGIVDSRIGNAWSMTLSRGWKMVLDAGQIVSISGLVRFQGAATLEIGNGFVFDNYEGGTGAQVRIECDGFLFDRPSPIITSPAINLYIDWPDYYISQFGPASDATSAFQMAAASTGTLHVNGIYTMAANPSPFTIRSVYFEQGSQIISSMTEGKMTIASKCGCDPQARYCIRFTAAGVCGIHVDCAVHAQVMLPLSASAIDMANMYQSASSGFTNAAVVEWKNNKAQSVTGYTKNSSLKLKSIILDSEITLNGNAYFGDVHGGEFAFLGSGSPIVDNESITPDWFSGDARRAIISASLSDCWCDLVGKAYTLTAAITHTATSVRIKNGGLEFTGSYNYAFAAQYNYYFDDVILITPTATSFCTSTQGEAILKRCVIYSSIGATFINFNAYDSQFMLGSVWNFAVTCLRSEFINSNIKTDGNTNPTAYIHASGGIFQGNTVEFVFVGDPIGSMTGFGLRGFNQIANNLFLECAPNFELLQNLTIIGNQIYAAKAYSDGLTLNALNSVISSLNMTGNIMRGSYSDGSGHVRIVNADGQWGTNTVANVSVNQGFDSGTQMEGRAVWTTTSTFTSTPPKYMLFWNGAPKSISAFIEDLATLRINPLSGFIISPISSATQGLIQISSGEDNNDIILYQVSSR